MPPAPSLSTPLSPYPLYHLTMQSTLDDDPYGYADEYQDHYGFGSGEHHEGEGVHLSPSTEPMPVVNFEDPEISSLPRILLMGPRRSGKTSIQVRIYCTGIWLLFVGGYLITHISLKTQESRLSQNESP